LTSLWCGRLACARQARRLHLKTETDVTQSSSRLVQHHGGGTIISATPDRRSNFARTRLDPRRCRYLPRLSRRLDPNPPDDSQRWSATGWLLCHGRTARRPFDCGLADVTCQRDSSRAFAPFRCRRPRTRAGWPSPIHRLGRGASTSWTRRSCSAAVRWRFATSAATA